MTTSSTAPLRVLHISEPGMDGVFRSVEAIIRFLLRQGVQVDFAYSSVRSSEGLHRLVADVRQAGGETLDLKVGNAPCLRDIPALFRLYRLARKRRPHIVHTSSSKAGVLGRTLALMGVRAEYIYTPNAYYGMGKSGGKVPFYNAIERFFARVGTTINVSADELRFGQERLGINPSRQVLIYNAADMEKFKPANPAQRKAARQRFGLPEEAVVLGTAARFAWQKDPHTLYSALEQIMPRHPNLWFLHLSSGGEYAAEIQESVRRSDWGKRVVFFPYIEDPVALYHALDGFVLTSRFEGFPYVFIEALAADLPMVLTEFSGGSSIFDLSLSHCWHAPIGDVAGVTQAFQSLLADLDAKRPSNHRQIAMKNYDEQVCYHQLLDLYQHTRALK